MKMGSNYLAILGVTTVTTVMSCSPAKKEYASFELYPVRTEIGRASCRERVFRAV